MRRIELPAPGGLSQWREVARQALAASWAPHELSWVDAGEHQDLFAAVSAEPVEVSSPLPLKVPAALLELAQWVLCHRSPARLGLLYRVLWRVVHGERQLLERVSDPDIVRLGELAKAVRRDHHKMKAFVRFRAVDEDDGPVYLAWFEPDHRIVRLVAPFFAKRFTAMRWSILTPDACAHWSGESLEFSPGVAKPTQAADALEQLWRTYYAHIFNPARLNVPMMQKEMPQKYWKNLPEAQLIPGLVQTARSRTGQMLERAPSVPRKRFPGPRRGPAYCPQMPHHAPAPALTDTLRWLERAVIGLNLCPFAKAVLVKQQIRWVVSAALDEQTLLAELEQELRLLDATDPSQIDTTVLIHPQLLRDFHDYNDFLELADNALEELGLAGTLQIASFHPDYQFADAASDDPGNNSNRSPHPMLHLLRESSVARAVAAFPDAAMIFERNIETLRALGHAGWRGLLADPVEVTESP